MPAVPAQGVGCAKCCSLLSASGVVFLSLIGHLLRTQPKYIVGIDDSDEAANQCFGAVWIYVSCIVLCIAVLIYDKLRGKDAPIRSSSMSGGGGFGSGGHMPDLTERENRLLDSLDRPRTAAGVEMQGRML